MSLTFEEYKNIVGKTPIRSAVVNITDQCNLRCPYCFTSHNSRVISMETLKKVTEFLYKEKEKDPSLQYDPSISFFGGEPTLYFDDIIVPFIEWTKAEGLKFLFNITTNGLLLTRERLTIMKELNIRPLLSIDGDKYTQDHQRPLAGGGSSFDVLKNNIPNILEFFPNITFRSAIDPENVDYIPENYLFARGHGFKNYFLTPNTYSKNWNQPEIFKLTTYLWLISCIMLGDIEAYGTTCFFNDIKKYIQNYLNNENNQSKVSNKRIIRCGLGTTGIGVACDGTINGCQEHNTYVNNAEDVFNIGDINTGIDLERGYKLITTYLASESTECIEDISSCQECNYRPFCHHLSCPSRNIFTYLNDEFTGKVTCSWQQTLDAIARYWITKDNNEKIMKFIFNIKKKGEI